MIVTARRADKPPPRGDNPPMSLPILNTPAVVSPDDLLRLFHRTELQWARQVGQEQTLPAGSAIFNPDAPQVIDANAIFDAAVPEGTDPATAIAEVDAFYASQQTRCRAWVINPSISTERADTLAAALTAAGATPQVVDVMHTAQPIIPDAPAGDDLKIIPARASFTHTRRFYEQAIAHLNVPNFANVCMMRYDDPHYDALLALRGGEPVGHVGVLSVGEIGRVDEVYIVPALRGRGLGKLMLARAMDICLRSVFRHVMLSVEADNHPAKRIYRACGMEVIGQFTSYRRT